MIKRALRSGLRLSGVELQGALESALPPGKIKNRVNIVLTGFMATGKTVVGRTLARHFSMKYIDTDSEIEKEAGCTIPEIFNTKGESWFRDIENRIVRRVAHLDGHVVATGGGVVLREENMKVLEKNGVIICLTASPEVILKRASRVETRPLLQVEDPMARIKELLEIRRPYYQRCHLMVDTSDKSVKEVVRKIVSFVNRKRQ